MTSHGHAKVGHESKTYRCWANLIARCTNPKHRYFANYGGRGITVCSEWRESFAVFLNDMGECPPGLTIDREDSNGNYKPGNCRWATRVQQNRNTRRNLFLTVQGVTKCLAEWAECLGVRSHVIGDRLRMGWEVGRAVAQPVRLWRAAL